MTEEGRDLVLPFRRSWHRGLLALGLTLVVFLLALGVYYRGAIWTWIIHYSHLLADKERVKSALEEFGSFAPVIFVLLQALQVVLAPIPGEATGFIGGYLFGVPLGLFYSTLGLTVGSVLAFLIARWLEEHYVAKWLPPQIMQKFDFLIERQGALIAFILFLLPGFPKDYLCFLLGLTTMPFRLFLLICILGRLPGTFLLTLQGAKVYKGDYITTAAILGLCLVVIVVLAYYREAVYRWIRHYDHREEETAARKK